MVNDVPSGGSKQRYTKESLVSKKNVINSHDISDSCNLEDDERSMQLKFTHFKNDLVWDK